jgi:hypothetical protein
METPSYDQLRQVYSLSTDEELVRLAAKFGELTDQAKEELGLEMRQRGLELQGRPLSTMSPPSEPENAALLNQFKEELFSLQSKKLSGVLAPEEYTEAIANLEPRMKRIQDPTVSDSNPLVSTELSRDQSPKKFRAGSLVIPLCIATVLFWAALQTFVRVHMFDAGAVGFYLGTLLLPFLLAYAIAGAKRRRSWVKFSYWFLALGIIIPSLNPPKSLTNLSHSDMLRELVGSKPLEDNLPEDQREMASATKAFFADIATFRKSHDDQLDALKPDLGQLYTAESFSNKPAMQRSLNAVDKELSLDLQISEMLKQIPEMARTRIDQTDLPESEKEKFMAGLMKSFNGSEYIAAHQQAIAAASAWVDSADDLYGFAIQHASQIIVTKDRIGIASDTIRGKFNEKLIRSEGLLDKYLAAGKKADDIRAANLKRSGISDADLGADK